MTATHVMVVLADPAPGRDAELDEWYADHLRRMSAVDGVVAVRRLVPVTGFGSDPGHRSIALYELRTDDLTSTVAMLAAARATFPATDAFARDPVVWFLEPAAIDVPRPDVPRPAVIGDQP
ncbi:MAG TPA: hypothetical protein PLV68_11220 [Ilumatobacteraceae bacterium]|nr:hypothetical protein [Ilumatobacteraceae bacterium]